MADDIDYKDLLRRYLSHVGNEEGCTFVHSLDISDETFTEQEIEELKRIDKTVEESNQKAHAERRATLTQI